MCGNQQGCNQRFVCIVRIKRISPTMLFYIMNAAKVMRENGLLYFMLSFKGHMVNMRIVESFLISAEIHRTGN